MGKSGQGSVMRDIRDKRLYIIRKERPFWVKVRDFFLAVLLWSIWGYLFYPLFAVLGWKIFGVTLPFCDEALLKKSMHEMADIALFSVVIVLFIVLVILGWGSYNRRKFRRYNKRRIPFHPITSEILAKTFDTSVESIERAKRVKYIQFFHMPERDILKVYPKKVLRPNGKDFKYVDILFIDDWELVRQKSKFGFTHKFQKNA